jgi:hypothetical protein
VMSQIPESGLLSVDIAYTLFTYHYIFVPCCYHVANRRPVDLIRCRVLMFNSSCRLIQHLQKPSPVELLEKFSTEVVAWFPTMVWLMEEY